MKIKLIVVMLVSGLFRTSQSASIVCFQGCRSKFTRASLDNPEELIDNDCIDLTKKTMSFTFGFSAKFNGSVTNTMVDSFLNQGDWNVLVLDWEKEASPGNMDTSYAYENYAVPNAYKVGADYGNALVKLAQAGLNMKKMLLIGHSLGAHLTCMAGRVAKDNGHIIDRVIGGDPAGPMFDTYMAEDSAMDDTCGKFVLAIHTDPLSSGTSETSGHVDVWVNHGVVKQVQPGCNDTTHEKLGDQHSCSHNRAWILIANMVDIPDSFMAAQADDYESWVDSDWEDVPTILVGLKTKKKERGYYFMSTNSQYPFGIYEDGLFPLEYSA